MRVLLCAAIGVLAAASPAGAQFSRLSVTTGGAAANGSSAYPSVSANGRFVVFESTASNLAPGDDDTLPDVFLRDRDTDADGIFDEPGAVATRCLSADPLVAHRWNQSAKITPDGRYVFFTSYDAVAFPPAVPATIFRLDRQTGALLSATQAGSRTGHYDASADGDVVVSDLTVTEIAAGRTTTIPPPYALSPLPPPATLVIGLPSLSGDGSRIGYFTGVAVTGAPNTQNTQIYVYDRPSATWSAVPVPDPIGVTLGGNGRTAVVLTPVGMVRHALDTGVETPVYGFADLVAVSPDQRYAVASRGLLIDFDLGVTTPLGFVLQHAAFSAAGRWLIAAALADLPGTTNADAQEDIYAIDLTAFLDADHDTMDDRWETLFGVTDPNADPDGDGRTNAQEEDAGTHPNGQVRRYLAEGATGRFFHTVISLANPAASPAAAVLTFDRGDGTHVRRSVSVPGLRSLAVDVGAVPGLESADVSTMVESDRALGVERTMTWGGPGGAIHGSHSEIATTSPSPTWFLAEGSTVLGFDLFYLLQNTQATTTHATVRFLLPDGTVVPRTYDLAPGSRTTIYVNQIPGLDETDVSGDISADAPIVVERAMYRSTATQPFALGTSSMGVPAAATSWFLAEGATGGFFDLYVLLANPGQSDATVQAAFLRPDGSTVPRTYAVRAHSRLSVYVDGVPGLEATSVSTLLTSNVPIVAERAMYWPGDFFAYYEGHSSAGSTSTGLRWVVAGAESGGRDQAQTFILIANTENRAGSATITLLPDVANTSPPPPPFIPTVPLPPNSRTTVPFALGGRYGVLVESAGASPVQIVVESSVYRTPAGTPLWSAGSNALAAAVP